MHDLYENCCALYLSRSLLMPSGVITMHTHNDIDTAAAPVVAIIFSHHLLMAD